MSTIEAKLTGIFQDAAEAARLELVIVEPVGGRNGGSLTGSWQVMQDLDTRLTVQAEFGRTGAKFTLGGQALAGQPASFYNERMLFPLHVPGGAERVLEVFAAYSDGDRLRNLAGLLAGLLEPYAAKAEEAAKGGRVVEVTRSSWKDSDPASARFVVTIPDYLRGPDSEARTILGPAGFDRAVMIAASALGNTGVARELVLTALAEGRARACAGGADSRLLTVPEADDSDGSTDGSLGHVEYDRETGTYAVIRTPAKES